jgi:hypothetical protein
VTLRWQRREFLRLALIQLGAWPLVSTLGCDGDSGKPEKDSDKSPHDAGAPEPDPDIPVSNAVRARIARLQSGTMLATFFGDGEASNIGHVGAHYLAVAAPDHTDEQILAALEPTIRRIERHLSDADAIDALRNAVATEFEAVEVIDVEGWTLAPTEAALCALLWIADMNATDGGIARPDDDAG